MFQYLPKPLLHGERVTLVPMTSVYCTEKYLSWLNDPLVYAHLESGGSYTMDDLDKFICSNDRPDVYFWAILIENGNRHIGNIKIDKINPHKLSCEYGIMIGDTTEWGKRLAEEASLLVVDFCFNRLQLKSIELGLASSNAAAFRLYTRMGFTEAGTEISFSGKESVRMKLKNNH